MNNVNKPLRAVVSVGLLGLLLSTSPLVAAPKKSRTSQVSETSNAKLELICAVIAHKIPAAQVVPVLDALTEKRGENHTTFGRAPKIEKIDLGFTFRLDDVEVRSSYTNSVPLAGWNVPGREVAIRVKVDCEIRCEMDLAGIRVQQDPDYTDSFVVILPDLKSKATAKFPEGQQAAFEVNYGWLRSEWMDSEDAREYRKELYREALKKAEKAFERNKTQYRAAIVEELQSLARSKFHGYRIYVR